MSPSGYTITLCLADHAWAGLFLRAKVETKDILAAKSKKATYILVMTGG